MYTGFKQQYTFGWKESSLYNKTFANTSAKLYYGSAVGDKDSAAGCLPINLKAEGQMAYEKALLQLQCLEPFSMGAKQVVKIALSGTASADGNIKLTISGEDAVDVDVADGDTAAEAGAKVVTALDVLETWKAAWSDTDGIVLTRKEELANVTVNATNFKLEGTHAGLTVGSATAVTAGSANDGLVAFNIMTCGEAADGTADTAHAEKVITIYAKANEMVGGIFTEMTMPTNVKQYVYCVVDMPEIAASVTFSKGCFLLHFNPYI